MRRFPQPSSPPLTSICRRTSALRSSLQFPSASPFPSSDPALPGCKPGLHPMGAESRARRPAEVPSRRREPPSAQRPGALPGFCGDVARAVQAACGRATAPRRVSGGEPVRLGGRLGIPKGRAPWARVPGRAAPAVFGWKALAARMRPVPVRRVVRFGTGSVGRSLLRRALRLRRLRKGGDRSRVLGCGSFRPMAASLAIGRRGARSCGEAARPRPFGRGSAAPPRAVRGGAGGG